MLLLLMFLPFESITICIIPSIVVIAITRIDVIVIIVYLVIGMSDILIDSDTRSLGSLRSIMISNLT